MDRRQFVQILSGWTVSQTAYAQRTVTNCKLDLRFGVAQFDKYDPLAEIERLAAWGFDYAEPAVTKVMALSDAQFSAALTKARSAAIHVEAMNSLLPAELKVVGPRIDHQRVHDYLQRALSRAEALGAKVMVFGSGDARMVPAGFAKEEALAQLRDFLRTAGDEIVRNRYGMVIGIEALRKAECNILNRSEEAYALAVQANHPKIGITVDFFHLATEKEDPAVIGRARDHIVHLHFSDPTRSREFPRRGADHPGFDAFFSNLKEIGYRGRMSLEANTDDFQTDAPAGLRAVRDFYARTCQA